MRLIVKPVQDLTPYEYKCCYNANLDALYGDGHGQLRGDLYSLRHRAEPEFNQAVLLWDDNKVGQAQLLGWALVQKELWNNKITAMFWVKIRNRNKGYGTILMQEVKKIRKVPFVYPWTEESGAFFSKFKVMADPYERSRYLVKKPRVC